MEPETIKFVHAEFITLSMVISIAVSLAISAAVVGAKMLLTPKPKPPKEGDGNRSSTQTIRQPLGYRRRIYGEVKVGGHPVYMGAPVSKGNFQLCAVFAAHEVDAIRTIFVGDQAVYDTYLGGDGYATGPRWMKFFQTGSASYLALWKKLGTADQTAFDSLIARSNGEWTTEHRLRGCAAIHAEFSFEENIYAGGLPNLSAVIRGAKVYDPRDGGTRWTPNFALCLRDYFLAPIADGCFGALPDEIDDAEWSAAANVCDEIVATPTTGDAAVMHTVVEVDAALDTIELDGASLKFQWGDRVEIASTLTLPTGLSAATPYYAIPYRDRMWAPDNITGKRVAIKLATTYANALAATPINITGAGTGTITVTKTGEPRWTMNGAFTTDQAPRKIVEEMIASCGMHIPYVAGRFRPMGLVWDAPTLTLDEDDLLGPLKVSTKRARRDRFNALKGTYYSPLNDWQPSDYPPITSDVYEEQDGGLRIFNELDQPYTSRSGQAQRAAKTELVRNRFERVANYPAMLTAYDCKAGDMISINNARWEWAEKTFEVIDRKPVLVENEAGAPYLGIELVLNEASEDAFDWASSEEQSDPPVITPTLPDWMNIEAPGAPVVTEALYEGRFGSDIKAEVTLTWAPSISSFVRRYELEYKISADTMWTAGPIVSVDATGEVELSTTFGDFLPGQYDFRVRARTTVGAVSDWSTTLNKVILGLAAPPVALTGLTLQKISGHAVLRWNLSADLDVLRGGWIEFRHSPSETGATEADSTTIGDRIDGRTTTMVLPLKAGTYFARAVDKDENVGPFVSVSTDGATVLQWGAVDSLIEDPAFSGVKTNCAVSGGILSLSGSGNFDAIADLDLLPNLDHLGGTSSTGLYEFSAGFDFTVTTPLRLRAHLLATVSNELDQIDDRLNDIDDWENFDGTSAPGAADAWIEGRSTNDDPAGAPTWSSWERLDIADFNNRAHEFRAQLRTYDPAYNIMISELRVYAENLV